MIVVSLLQPSPGPLSTIVVAAVLLHAASVANTVNVEVLPNVQSFESSSLVVSNL